MKLIKQPKSESEFILLILVPVMAAPIDQTREIFPIWHPIHKRGSLPMVLILSAMI